MTHVVLMAIGPDAELVSARPVARQRAFARAALVRCAEFARAPTEGWRQDEHDRPVSNGGFHWSIAHKRACVAAAISNGAVGVDIERVKPRTAGHFDEIAAPTEWSIIGGRRALSFFLLWTAKESVLKLVGAGMAGWDDCRLTERIDPRRTRVKYRNELHMVEHFELEGHVAAVACAGAVTWHVLRADGRGCSETVPLDDEVFAH